MLPLNFFDRIEPVETGDARPEKIWLAVGKALSTWEATEDSYAGLFAFLMNPITTSYAARRAYGQLMAPGSRRDLIKGALDVFWRDIRQEAFSAHNGSELRAATAGVLHLHSSAMARRNEFAHGTISGLSLDKLPHRIVLAPGYYNHSKRKLDQTEFYRHNSTTILMFEGRFRKLGGEVFSIIRLLEALHAESRAIRARNKK